MFFGIKRNNIFRGKSLPSLGDVFIRGGYQLKQYKQLMGRKTVHREFLENFICVIILSTLLLACVEFLLVVACDKGRSVL